MEIKTITQAFEALTSSNPKIRMESAVKAVERDFWLSNAPEWFSLNKYPDVIGFDDTLVVYGTSFKNIKLITWDDLQSGNVHNEAFVDELLKKVA